MLLVLSAWATRGPLLMGLGLWVCRAYKLEPTPLDTFFLGASAAVLALQVWNLFLPVSGAALLVFGAASAAGWWRYGRQAAAQWRATSWRSPALVAFTLLAALWQANRSLGLTRNWDTGIYHLGSVLWAQAAPVVPGIGNVHPFLGVSHGFFELAALLGTGASTEGPQHGVNGLLAVALLALCARGLLNAAGGRLTPSSIAEAMLLPWAFFLALGREVSSLSTDLSEVAFGAFVISFWLRTLETKEPAELERRLDASVLLTTALVVLKLSGAGAVIGAVLAGALLTRRVRWLVRACVLATAAMLPWCIASILRTGALPYPGAIIRLPVDWRVPLPALEAVRMYTQSFARGTLGRWDQPAGMSWVLPRVENMLTWNREVVIPVGLALVTAVLVAVLPRRPANERQLPALSLWVPAFSLAVWFMSAPDERYAGVWLQATAAFAAALAVSHLKPRMAERLSLVLIAITLLRVADPLRDGLNLNDSGFVPPPAAPGEVVTTKRGTKVFQTKDQYCWANPLPCTSHPDPYLERRDPKKLSAGFRLSPPPPQSLDDYEPYSLELYPPRTLKRTP